MVSKKAKASDAAPQAIGSVATLIQNRWPPPALKPLQPAGDGDAQAGRQAGNTPAPPIPLQKSRATIPAKLEEFRRRSHVDRTSEPLQSARQHLCAAAALLLDRNQQPATAAYTKRPNDNLILRQINDLNLAGETCGSLKTA